MFYTRIAHIVCRILLFSIYAIQYTSYVSAELQSPAEGISELTQKANILTPEEVKELAGYIDRLGQDKENINLRQVHLDMIEKISRDKTQLDSLIHDLEKLAESNWSNAIGRVDRNALRASWAAFKKFESGYSELVAQNVSVSGVTLTPDFYIEAIKRTLRLLTGEGGYNTLSDVWQAAEAVAAGPYPAWNAKYLELKEKLNQNADYFGRYKYMPNYEEFEFTENLRQTQYLLRALSEPNSSKF
ncbi:MAG: hypothetical protein A2Z88_02755 [Omnitrophica WOR_2 bacterium GWA2_47_8]|nr:MAG: hypothetical protein A2Z88_02755 [Omnitrophica WOR_2 bacterium GWA2_47_8]